MIDNETIIPPRPKPLLMGEGISAILNRGRMNFINL